MADTNCMDNGRTEKDVTGFCNGNSVTQENGHCSSVKEEARSPTAFQLATLEQQLATMQTQMMALMSAVQSMQSQTALASKPLASLRHSANEPPAIAEDRRGDLADRLSGLLNDSSEEWHEEQDDPHEWNDEQEQPLLEDPDQELQPPPSTDGLPQYKGYELVAGFDKFVSMPPKPLPCDLPSSTDFRSDFPVRATILSESQCRGAMMNFVAQRDCYGTRSAKGHHILKIQTSSALHYVLETFCEARSVSWKYEPFCGQPIDDSQTGSTPGPWDIACQPDLMFRTQKTYIDVPHSSIKKPCQRCDAKGYLRCPRCGGGGHLKCISCGGDGRVNRYVALTQRIGQERCFGCGGYGRRRCATCGDGSVTCSTCRGYSYLRCFLQLEVTFTNHKDEYFFEGTEIPAILLWRGKSEMVLEQSLLQVKPIQDCPIEQIAQNSVRLVEAHRTKFPSERQLQQRQTLQAVPVTEVDAEWNDWQGRYWVYGLDRKVYCPHYPQTCCLGCHII